MHQVKTAILLGAAALWLCVPAAAQNRPQADASQAQEKPFQPFVPDAKTLALLDRSSSYVAPPDNTGRRRLVTNGGHQHVLMARIGPDGKVEMFCADSAHAAQSWGAAPTLLERER